MNRRMLFATLLVSAAAAATAATAAHATAALVACRAVIAGGKTWQVRVVGVRCATARVIVRQVAVRKPDRVTRAHGREIDQYAESFFGLRCFKSGKAGVGGEIQCTGDEGRKTVLAVYRG